MENVTVAELFEREQYTDWWTEWVSMPEYNNEIKDAPLITATFKFRSQDDYNAFHKLIKQHIYNGSKVFDGMQRKAVKNTWYPLRAKASQYNYDGGHLNPRFPVYIVSKGRWKRRPTSTALERMKVPYFIVVEEQEYEQYCSVISKDKVLILNKEYQDNYDTFWERKKDQRTGVGAARNFCWDDSIKRGYEWHWVMDDNIESIERYNNNMKIRCADGTPFYIIEDFVLRYENIAQAGMGYAIFCPDSERRPPIRLNTRIYSCLLIRNDIPFRWRGRYNEDTDLSLRILKAGWASVEFNAFLIGKRATQSMGGGNTAEFYAGEGTYNKSKMLVDMHPDVTTLTKKFNRWHHHVDYSPFKKNKLIRKQGLSIPTGVNNYGMKLVSVV